MSNCTLQDTLDAKQELLEQVRMVVLNHSVDQTGVAILEVKQPADCDHLVVLLPGQVLGQSDQRRRCQATVVAVRASEHL